MTPAYKCESLEEFVTYRVYDDRSISVNMMKEVLKNLGIKYKSSARWIDLFNLLKEKEVNAMCFYQHFPKHFCVIKNDFIERFNLTDREYNFLKKNDILKEVTKIPSSHSSSQHLSGFCVEQFFTVTEEELKSQVPPKDLKKAERFKQARIKSLTCVRCGKLQFSHKYINKEKVCNDCREKEEEINRINYYANCCKEFLNDNYLILETATTGLDYDDEIIELAIMDMEGNTLYESLFKTTKSITDEANRLHKIDDEMLKNAPKFEDEWQKILDILKGKTALIYNADFEDRMICQTLKADKLLYERPFKMCCFMEFYQEYTESAYWISLADACYYADLKVNQNYRAVNDCRVILELIKAIANKKKDDGSCSC